MSYYDLISFIALSLTGMFLMSFGSFFAWLLCTMMEVTKKLIAVPLLSGLFVVYAAIHFFYTGA